MLWVALCFALVAVHRCNHSAAGATVGAVVAEFGMVHCHSCACFAMGPFAMLQDFLSECVGSYPAVTSFEHDSIVARLLTQQRACTAVQIQISCIVCTALL